MTGRSDVLAAWREEGRNLSQVEIDNLVSRGVPPLALGRDPLPWRDGYAMRAARVVVNPALGLFDFSACDPASTYALILPLRDESGDAADLLAWSPREDRAALWAGNVCLAGQQEISSDAGGQEPVQVRASILEWLRAGRAGVVVLDPAGAAFLLNGVTVAAANSAIGRALDSLLTLRPRIVVPVTEHRRAA